MSSKNNSLNRRGFIKASAASSVAAGISVSPFAAFGATATATTNYRSPNEQVGLGFIGTGIRFYGLVDRATEYGPGVALADADMLQAGRGLQKLRDRHMNQKYPLTIGAFEDYRRVLDNKDVNIVVVASPDHWHTRHVIDSMRAGKDVYCEKPLTLTIAEGSLIEKVQKETGRVIQIGTQQRTEMDGKFAQAAAMVRDGRVGDLDLVTICLGGSRTCDPLPKVDPPKNLNWDLWLGQAPMTAYRESKEYGHTSGWGAGHKFSRTHRYYRWFYEYSGGKLTDWGAHHVDIAMLAVDKLRDDIGNIEINPIEVAHPMDFEKGMPTKDDQFNCATKFKVELKFADGLTMHVRDEAPDKGLTNGIMFEGKEGRFVVNRGKIVGKPVEQLKEKPLPEDSMEKLYGQPMPKNHMDNFMECVKSRKTPISDLQSHNCMLNVCHAINIALRLNRKLTYDPKARKFVGDDLANSFVAREQRKGYELS